MRLYTISLIACFAIAAVIMSFAQKSNAESFNQGPKVCAECHRGESEVWQGTKHATSFKTVHKGKKSTKRNATCVQCHYTEVSKKAADESGEHKTERITNAAAAGIRWPSDKYGVAENCMECHGLTNPNIAADKLAIMLDSGHPTVADWELVRSSQGSIRHRFYPPDMTVNREMSAAETAELFAIGQAAKLVSSVTAAGRSDSAKFKEFQEARAAEARDALGKVGAASALLASPTTDEARLRYSDSRTGSFG